MKRYKYLGYGVTNSNGVAHLDHDPQGNPINGYTGTGAGEVDVIASTDNPITSSSILSEPYPVFDCPVYDGDNTPTSISWSKTNNAVVTDEVVSLIASVLNTNNNPCINIPVVFKRGNTVLGTAYTDCNGDATMTYTWADSDIFDVTAQVGQSLSEDITMFVKDKDNILSYNQWSCGDYSNNLNGFTKRPSDTCNYELSDEWSGNGKYSIKFTGSNWDWVGYQLGGFTSTAKQVQAAVNINIHDNARVYLDIIYSSSETQTTSVDVTQSGMQTLTLTIDSSKTITRLSFRVTLLADNISCYVDDFILKEIQ